MPDAAEETIERRGAFGLEVRRDTGHERRLRLSFSSEEPLLRNFEFGRGWEILGHQPGEADLGRLASGAAPLLRDHEASLGSMIGVIEAAEITGGRGVAVVRFSATEEAGAMLARVRDGEISSVSVGYAVSEWSRAGERDGVPVMRATRWEPREISLVALPADTSVGVGRSGSAGAQKLHSRETKMTDTTETHDQDDRSETQRERARVREINATARAFDMPGDLVSEAIDEGISPDAFKRQVLERLGQSSVGPSHAGATRLAMREEGGQPYSLTRLVDAHLTGDWSRAGFERECEQQMRHLTGRAAEGVYVPPVALAGRNLLTSTNAASMIGTEHAFGEFIDALRPEVQVMTLGAMVLQGLTQNLSMPRMPSGTSAEWVAEDSSASESEPSFDSVTLSLHQLSARTRMSRRQVKQSQPGMDMILSNDLRQQIAVALDRAAIAGAGSAIEPEGILNTSGVGSVAIGADGGELTWLKVTELMAAVEGANAAKGSLGFLSNHAVKAAMLATPKFPSGGDTAILTTTADTPSVAGHPAAFTSLVPADGSKGTGSGDRC